MTHCDAFPVRSKATIEGKVLEQITGFDYLMFGINSDLNKDIQMKSINLQLFVFHRVWKYKQNFEK